MLVKRQLCPYGMVTVAILLATACYFPFPMVWSQTTPETTTSQSEEVPAAAETPVPAPESALLSYEAANPAPDTLTALRSFPEQAQIAVGIPSAVGLLERAVPFAQLFLPEVKLAEEIQLIASDLAVDMEVPNEGGLVGVLAAMGLDSHAGMALFLNLEDVVKTYAEALSQNTVPDTDALAKVKALLVIPVNDPVKAEASLMKLLGELLSGTELIQTDVEGITVKEYAGMGGYFVNDTVLALGNDMDLLASAAKRTNVPAQFQYGSTVCPPDDIHEAAVLFCGDRILPFIDMFKEPMALLEPSMQVLVKAQIERLQKIYQDATAKEPLIITAKVDEKLLEIKSKLNTAVYPGIMDYLGTATPLHWAQRLPERTLAFLSFNFTEEFKNQLSNDYVNYLPEEIRNSPGASQGIMYATNALQLLGGEFTIGVANALAVGYPGIYLITELADTEGAEIFLQMAPQTDYETPYRDIQIKEIQAPLPIPIYFAVVENALIISNDVEGIRGIIDLSKDAKTSGLFETLTPPIPVTMPLYQAFMVKLSLYSDIISPLAAIMGQALPGDLTPIMDTAAGLFENIQIRNGMEDTWSVWSLGASRKP